MFRAASTASARGSPGYAAAVAHPGKLMWTPLDRVGSAPGDPGGAASRADASRSDRWGDEQQLTLARRARVAEVTIVRTAFTRPMAATPTATATAVTNRARGGPAPQSRPVHGEAIPISC